MICIIHYATSAIYCSLLSSYIAVFILLALQSFQIGKKKFLQLFWDIISYFFLGIPRMEVTFSILHLNSIFQILAFCSLRFVFLSYDCTGCPRKKCSSRLLKQQAGYCCIFIGTSCITNIPLHVDRVSFANKEYKTNRAYLKSTI